MRRPRVFFAIPCGDYYSAQQEIIDKVTAELGVDTVIAERNVQTKSLWESIENDISRADLFMADVTSMNSNIILELGYALRDQPIERVGIFCTASTNIPADMRGFVRQQYHSLSGFGKVLELWLRQALPLIKPTITTESDAEHLVFTEDFMDEDALQTRWYIPTGASCVLLPEGLFIGHAHLPILTQRLAILRNYKLTFGGRIVRDKLGWVVMASFDRGINLPSFCIMFNLDTSGLLTPHIFNIEKVQADIGYKAFADSTVKLTPPGNDWFDISTDIVGSMVSVSVDGSEVFRKDMENMPFSEYFRTEFEKQGQIGFRCHPGEKGIVRRVEVREL